MQTIVIGHRNPDMDSVCSAIGYAELKRQLGVEGVIAARPGATNARIDFVLNKFGVEAPQFISDLHPRVCDLMQSRVISINANTSVAEAVRLIEENELRGLPVVDENQRFLGLLSAFKVLHHLFPSTKAAEAPRPVTASLEEIVKTFEGALLVGDASGGVRRFHLVVGAMSLASFEGHLQRYDQCDLVALVGDREEIQLAAIERGVRALVVTGNHAVQENVKTLAESKGVAIFNSPYDTATTVSLARGAEKVELQVESDYISFTPDTLLETARAAAAESGQFLFPVLEGDRLAGIIGKSDFLRTISRQLILVDHNELTQAVPGADKVPIIEVIDHHRLGGIATSSPILFWNNPVGSTSSIVTMCYRQHGIEIPKPIAGLLMAGLISDTLNLTSPTTTPVDGEIMAYLSGITGVDPATLAREIFSVGSPLLTLTPEQAVTADCKEYAERGHRFSVAQIEEISFENFYEKQEALVAALDAHCKAGNFFFASLLVTDINTQNSILLVCGADAYLKRIDYPNLAPNQWELNGVVSRKKQLLPYLTACLAGLDPA